MCFINTSLFHLAHLITKISAGRTSGLECFCFAAGHTSAACVVLAVVVPTVVVVVLVI